MNYETIGQLAVDLHAATQARKNAKRELRDKYAEFCGLHGMRNDSVYLNDSHEEYPAMQEYAAEEVKAYARAKLTEYNVKRKLERAINTKRSKPTELQLFAARVESVLSEFLYGTEEGLTDPLHDLLGAACDIAPPSKKPSSAEEKDPSQIDMAEVWEAAQ